MGAFEWILTGYIGVTSVLIGWQVYAVIYIERRIRSVAKSVLDKELPKAKGEAIGTAIFKIADQAQRNGDLGYALTSFIQAAYNLKNTGSFSEEIELSLDHVEKILGRIDPDKIAMILPKNTEMEYYNMLRSINDRSRGLADLFLQRFYVLRYQHHIPESM